MDGAFPKRRSFIAALVASLQVVGCMAAPGSSFGPSTASTASVAAPSAAPSETAEPIREIPPDLFWFGASGGETVAPVYQSLEAILAESDLVIVGTVTGIRRGRDVEIAATGETMYQATLLVRVDATVSGTVEGNPDPPVVQIEFLLAFNPGHYDVWAASLPKGDQVLLFLVNKGEEARRLGLPADSPGWGREYYAIRNPQGYVRNVSGRAAVAPDPEGKWLAGWSGASFDEVVAEVRLAASTAQGTKATAA